MVPRTDSAEFAMRPLCVQVSDLDVLIEFDPENKVRFVSYIKPFLLTKWATATNDPDCRDYEFDY